jgi:hypothetical protein
VVFDLVIARYLRTALEVDIAAGAEKRRALSNRDVYFFPY